MKWCPSMLKKLFSKSAGSSKALEAPAQKQENAGPEPDPVRIPPIKKAVVIGAGVMGSGIAAQLANAGIEVLLLDKLEGAADKAVERMLKARLPGDPMNAGFMSPENARLIATGTQDKDLHKIADADWICEVIIEDLALKQGLFTEIEKHRKPGSIVSSNTSTIPLAKLTEKLPEAAKKDYLITHFFNPVRFMPLLEIVGGKHTRPDAMEKLGELCDIDLGKNVVKCNDTPGFIANRLGSYLLKRSLNEAIDKNMKIEDVDAVMGPPMGFPKMGIFGLLDTVGIDISPYVINSMKNNLPATDGIQPIANEIPLVTRMIKEGRVGRKGKTQEGFYRRGKSGKEAVDLQTGEYRPAEKSSLKSAAAGRKGLQAVFETPDHGGKFAWEVMRDTLVYALEVAPQLSDDISAIDEAMRAGYNWKRGPFEMIDAMGSDKEAGVDYFIRKLTEEKRAVPKILQLAKGHPFYHTRDGQVQRLSFDLANDKIEYKPVKTPEGVLSLADVKRTQKPVGGNDSVSLWDLGDGVICAELHGMKNTLGPETMVGLNDACDLIEGSNGKYTSMVIYSDNAAQFAVGMNLGLASYAMNLGNQDLIDDTVYDGQMTLSRLKYSKFPVVAAIGGMALGGGCEIPLHCDAIQAHAETQIGLVEVGVGIIPGWGGCKEYLGRCFEAAERDGPAKSATAPLLQAFEKIGTAYFSQSAQDAKNNLFLRPTDGITMNRNRLLADAKAKAQRLTKNYQPRPPYEFRLDGAGGMSVMRMAADDAYAMGAATWHDVRVMEALGRVLTGGNTNASKVTTETELLRLEREGLMRLAKTPQTRARIRQMVNTGKPLREKPMATPMETRDLRATLPPVTLKERPADNPYVKAPVASNDNDKKPAVDIKKLKPMDAIIATIEGMSAMPPASDLPAGADQQALQKIFNEAAMAAREGTLVRLKKGKSMAGFLPASKLKAEVLGGFDKSIEKGQARLSEVNDPYEQTKIKATIATMKQYKQAVGKLDF